MATRSAAARVELKMTGTITNAQTSAGESGDTLNHDFSHVFSQTFANGTSANQVQRGWNSENRAISSGGSENLDLYDMASVDVGGGAGLDPLGGSLALSGIKALIIKNESSSAGNLVVGNESSAATWNSFFSGSDTATFTLVPGASFCVLDPSAAGLAVADTSNHLLKMAAPSGDVDYTIALIGI
jgi:hypothetical protein